MSLKTLTLSKATPVAAPASAKDRARAKVVGYLEQQAACLAAQLQGRPFDVVRQVYKTNDAGERVKITRPTFVRKGWFEDSSGTVFFMVRYGSKALRLDKSGNFSVEVGKLDALPSVIDTLLNAVTAGELDAQLVIAAQERSKGFKRRTAANAA